MPTPSQQGVQEDPLIQGLLVAKGKKVEVIAFGIAYCGWLVDVDVRAGYATVEDGADRAMLDFERIEAFRLLE